MTEPGSTQGPDFVPTDWDVLATLVDRLLEAPRESRDALLAELSGDDADRRRALAQLLEECLRELPLVDGVAIDRFADLAAGDDEDPVPSVLGDRYRIEREVGRGGMARVFLATDLQHQRPVAVKVVRGAFADSSGSARFRREIQTAAHLRHPNIVPLYDSGDADGLLYFVMPFEEGKSLRELLSRGGTRSLSVTVGILRDVARALAYSHEHGVVHRDIKPENVMLSGDAAVVTDFGIARALSVSQGTGDVALTQTGVVVGTPSYMAPEQGAADGGVDHRVDIYAFGCLGFELLTGKAPFDGLSGFEVLAAKSTRDAPSVSTLVRDVPDPLASLIDRCLQRDPAERPQQARELLAVLDQGASARAPSVAAPRRSWRVAVLALLGVVVAGSAWWALRARTTSSPAAGRLRIAVVPFRETGRPSSVGFAAGLATALRSDLARLPSVDVIAGTSVDALGDSARRPSYVASQLGATHVLSGTVQWNDAAGVARVRVVPELIVLEGNHERAVASDPIDVAVADLFSTEAQLASAISQTLGVAASAAASVRSARAPTKNAAAYEAFLRAGYFGDQRMELLQQAVTLDSTFALAWAQIGADAASNYNLAPDATMSALTRDATTRAMQLDSLLPDVRVARGMYERHITRDFPAAVRQFLEALRLAPGDVDIMTYAAGALWSAGRIDEALEIAKRAAALDPRNPSAVARVATLYIWQRDLHAAPVTTGRALDVSRREIAFINMDSVLLPLMTGDLAAARRFVGSLGPGAPVTGARLIREWNLGWPLDSAQHVAATGGLRGPQDLAMAWTALALSAWVDRNASVARSYADSAIRGAREALRRLPDEAKLHIALANAYAVQGRMREALEACERASALRSVWKDAFQGAVVSLNVAQVRAMAGDHDHAIALVDSLLGMPGFVTPAYLRIDPFFRDLRGNPAFQRLLER